MNCISRLWSLLFVKPRPHSQQPRQGLFITSREWQSSKLRNCLNIPKPYVCHARPFFTLHLHSPHVTHVRCSSVHLLTPIKGSFNLVSWQRDSKQQCWDSQDMMGHQTVWTNHHHQSKSVYTSCNNLKIWNSYFETWYPASFFKGLHLLPLMKKKVWRHSHF